MATTAKDLDKFKKSVEAKRTEVTEVQADLKTLEKELQGTVETFLKDCGWYRANNQHKNPR